MKIFLKKNHSYQLVMILVLALLSIAAWWSKDKTKNDVSNTQAQQKQISKTTGEKIAPVQTDQKANEKPKVEEKKVKGKLTKTSPQKKLVSKKQRDVETAPEISSSQKQDVEKVQGDLRDIISRTQQLQNQVKSNRLEIQNILERAQIHEQILRKITLPPPVPTKQQFDPEEVIKYEKIRLITEQVKKTEEQLRVIQQTRSIDQIEQATSSETKASKPS